MSLEKLDSTEPLEMVLPDLRYDRVCRTGHSEAYLLSEGDLPFGRVDLHFGASVVNGVLVLERDFSNEELHGLVQRIDDDLVWTADVRRDDFIVTVYRGTEIGVIADEDEDDDNSELDEEDDEDDEA